MKNKKVVITGGAGFVGSNLARELAIDNTVNIIDDLSTGREKNLDDIINKRNVSFVKGSILNQNLLQSTFNGADYIFHQAALASVPLSVDNPALTHDVNITGTLNVLIAARDNQAKKVVFASSSAIYGDGPILPKKEDMAPDPKSPYAVTKLAGEYYCHSFYHIYGLPTVSLRYFNVYGPYQAQHSQYAAVIPHFINNIQHGHPPVIYGDGKQTRDFIYIQDVIQANIAAAESEASGIFNIGAGDSTTIKELALTLIDIMNKDMQPAYQAQRPGDIKNSQADVSLAREVMGYQPRYCLKDGLKETAGWFLKQA
jgi:UDP-glucose 4-epimerase